MIYRLETIIRKLKRVFSRSRFVVWLFGMSKSAAASPQRGIIMLQIDGLSKHELQRAIDNGYMPFTKKILQKEHYHLHSLYAGVPSCTPAAHGELFYGVKGCVPAFRFKRPEDKRPMAMLEPSLAQAIQAKLEDEGQPLMRGGSVFSDMFDGGAEEASFCASSMGWSSLVPSRHFFKMALFVVLNIGSVIKVILLIGFELFLAVVDIFRGVLSGQNLIQEIKFVPIRIATAVLLRELVTIGINLDSSRGVPIIHGNYLSYDEQSHRRGPDSRFAHWALKGIDRTIARVWKVAKQSEYREYDIWIHSDHGQEKTKSYPDEYNETLRSAVNRVLLSYVQPSESIEEPLETEISHDPNLQRLHLLGNKRIDKWLLNRNTTTADDFYVEFSIAAMGPLGFIYLEQALNDNLKNVLAKDLAGKAHIPMVMFATKEDQEKNQASIWKASGKFHLPEDKRAVFGENHPFLDEVCADFIALCHHEYSGNFVLSGWSSESEPMSLRVENGAHAGPGENETHAFALLPEDTKPHQDPCAYIRFLDLYHAAQQQINNLSVPVRDKSEQAKRHLRVMTYNIHSCIGMDGRMSPHRIARVIAMYQPDIVALQEVHSSDKQSKFVDQIKVIADELGMQMAFNPAKSITSGYFGNAILSKHPLSVIESRSLNSGVKRFRPKIKPFVQTRGLLEVEIDYQGKSYTVVNTHLGLTAEDRRAQMMDIINSQSFAKQHSPTILCGDFNATPRQNAYKMMKSVMMDVEEQTQNRLFRKTFPSRYPVVRLDHIFVDRQIKVQQVIVPANHLTKVASDHLPVIADIEIDD